MNITFPGGLAVEADYKGFIVRTDQPETAGGGNSAPSPFDLFLISLGTCAGYFALRFCRQRGLDTTGLKLSLSLERDEEKHLPAKMKIAIHLPEGFPDKYRQAIIRATDQCTVKRTILNPPAFEVTAV